MHARRSLTQPAPSFSVPVEQMGERRDNSPIERGLAPWRGQACLRKFFWRRSGLLSLTALAAMLASAPASAAAAEAPKVQEAFLTEVTSSSAVLHAEINPDGAAASYRFEVAAATASYAPVVGGEGNLGAGTSDVSASVAAQGLLPATSYHFRVVATNALGTDEGAAGSFTTHAAGSEFALPDGRQWELVSPPDKHGASIEPITFAGGDIQASEAGNAITYVASGPMGSEPEGNPALDGSQIFSERGPDGWISKDVATPHEAPSGVSVGEGYEYKLFSPDLAVGGVQPKGYTPLPPLPAGSEKTIYLRHQATNAYQALVTAANARPGAEFGSPAKEGAGPQFQGASPSLANVVFYSQVGLTLGEPGESGGLYEWSEGKIYAIAPPGSSLGYSDQIVRGAVAESGTRVVWTAGNALYLTDPRTGESSRIDLPEAGAGAGVAQPLFEDANNDASRIFFTDPQALTGDATPNEPSLYVYESNPNGAVGSGRLTDLTAAVSESESGAMIGHMIGYGDEGVAGGGERENVYFVDSGALAAGATLGGDNLYTERFNGGTWERPRLVATLSPDDAPTWGVESGVNSSLVKLTARVSPNGRYLAFMSDRPLTGYDNHDASSGVVDEEVFLYDVQSQSLVCASCNPAGARPAAIFEPAAVEKSFLLVDEPKIWGQGRWLAANVPGWTPTAGYGQAFYQSRYLTNSGRLFFDSVDALVPADVNGKEDVYEYEPAGSTCDAATQSQSEVFEEQAQGSGCVALISSGKSGEESAFLDASGMGPDGEEGEDVFFLTAAQLVPEDIDSAFDIYDAHRCSGVSPCPALAASAPPPCENTDSCRNAPTPQPEIFGTSASATFSGAGNAAAAGPLATRRELTRTQRLAAGLRTCRSMRKRRSRSRCEAKVRKRYRSHGTTSKEVRRSH